MNPSPPQGTHDARAVLDVHGAMQRMGGRRPIYVKVLYRFEPEFGQAAEMIEKFMSAGDMRTAERTAHSVKGVAATIGATALSEVAANLEKAIARQAPEISQTLARFGMELGVAIDSVRVFLQQEEPHPDRLSP